MSQDDLARRIVQHLNAGLDDIPAPVTERLHAARREALRHAHARQAHRDSLFGRLRDWVSAHGVAVRVAVPAAFAAAAAGLLYWQVASHHESIDVETALLADELPIHAYTDPGFDAWLQHSSHEQQ
ncbi:MAG: DUF3619 family protein [Burkholderiales bacterium]